MKKVLFTASTYSHIRNFHLPYLRYFQENGWKVHVGCAGSPNEVPFADDVLELSFKKKMTSLSNLRASIQLRRKAWAEQYTLITTHTSLAAFFTRLSLVGMRNRPKVVCMSHGYLFDDDTPRLKKRVLLTAERLMAPYTDLLLTMNFWDHATAKRYQLGKRVVNIPGIGVDFSRIQSLDSGQRQAKRRELGIPDDFFLLFYAAEFSRRKSQHVLIEALTYMPDHTVLILAGDGALIDECRDLAYNLGVEKRVIFPGYLQDVGEWYGIADAAVSASRSEGLPFNVMESMYAGVPVVASSVKGHDDLIENEKTGLLYSYGDPKACARQLTRLAGSPILREQLIRQAKERVLQYSLDWVLPIVIKEYESVL